MSRQRERRSFRGVWGALLSRDSSAGPSADSFPGSSSGFGEGPRYVGTPPLAPGDLLGGRFLIVDLLGEGGMGYVYSAEDTLVRASVAVKAIRPELVSRADSRERLIRELRTARQVTHPNVCRLYDVAEAETAGRPLIFLTMELLSGETLAERLDRRPPLTTDEAAALSLQFAEALGALHAEGIVHRDFKPANAMLVQKPSGPSAVVMDFGLAQPADSAPGEPVSQAGQLAGTLAYMAPEQTAGVPATAASDVCALGIVMARLFTGLELHAAVERSASGLRLTVAADAILRQAGSHWRRIVGRCLETDPARRYPTALSLAEALRKPPTIGRRAAAIAVAALCAAAVVATGVYWYWPAPIPAERHVAVLPFRQAVGKSLAPASLEGASEALARTLSSCCASPSLWFVPGSELKAMGGNAKVRPERALGVNLLLTGEVSESHGDLVVNLAVRDAATDRALRTASVRVKGRELASGENAISQSAVALLGGRPGSVPIRQRTPTSPGALQFREQALSYSARRDEGNLVIATELLHRSVEADPLYSEAYADLADVLMLRYGWTHDASLLTEAEQVCEKARRAGREIPGLLLAEAQLAGLRGNIQVEVSLIQRVLDGDPQNSDALSALARVYDSEGRTLDAQQTFQKAIDAHPGDFKAYNNIGHFYQQHGMNADAEKNFRIACDLAPDNSRALSNLGALLLYMHRNDEAVAVLRHGLEVRPSASGYSNLGTVLYYGKRFREAVDAYRRAVEMAPTDDRFRRNLGDAYSALGDFNSAKAAWSEAVDLVSRQMLREPGNPLPAASRALYLAKCGRTAEARTQVAEAIARPNADSAVLYRCAVALELSHQRTEALKVLKDAFAKGVAISEVQTTVELSELRKDPRFARLVPVTSENNHK